MEKINSFKYFFLIESPVDIGAMQDIQSSYFDAIDQETVDNQYEVIHRSFDRVFAYNKTSNVVNVFREKEWYVDGMSKLPMAALEFKPVSAYPNSKEVRRITVDKDHRNTGIATSLYYISCLSFGPILSDDLMHTGGISLWKSFAKSVDSDFCVDIVNVSSGEIVCKKYDGTNFDISNIWSKFPNISKKDVRLLLHQNDK